MGGDVERRHRHGVRAGGRQAEDLQCLGGQLGVAAAALQKGVEGGLPALRVPALQLGLGGAVALHNGLGVTVHDVHDGRGDLQEFRQFGVGAALDLGQQRIEHQLGGEPEGA
ncbi:hypothetical protein GCM10009680_69770 [Streptomyces yatensis]|uniref:Uncharacterized protein n=1 Tax=Streptomyces yatensis TaxID=155177 RepID=A0ABN2J5E7_9ACTN